MSAIEIIRRRGSHGGYRGANSLRPSFYLQPSGSVGNLPDALTIASVAKSPALKYLGGLASAAGWTSSYGAALALQAGTAPSYNQGSPLRGSTDDSVLGNGGGYYLCADTTTGNVGTGDLVAHLFFKAITTKMLFAKRNAGVGWEIGIDSSLRLYLTIQDASGATTTVSAALTSGEWNDAWIFARRAGSCQIYIQGAASGAAVSISSRALTLDSATALAALADSGGASAYTSNVALLAMWTGAAWLDTHLQATVAATQHAMLAGIYPRIARGTALPTAMTRASSAYVDVIDGGARKLYLMGRNFLRVAQRTDLGGVTDVGYLSEPVATNTCLQSEDITTTWSLGGSATSAADSAAAPNGLTTADTLTAVADGDYIKQTFASITAVQRTYSHYLQRNGATNVAGFIRLVKTSDGSTIAETAFTATALWQRFEVAGTCVLNDTEVRIVITTAGGSLYVWGGQVETGAFASSYVATTTVVVARAADCLRYGALSNWGAEGGRAQMRILLPNINQRAPPSYLYITDGTVNNKVALGAATTGDDFPTALVTSGGVAQASVAAVSDVWNGNWRRVAVICKANDVRVKVDGAVEGTPDTSVTVPLSLTQIDVGQYISAGYELGGLINKLEIYPR